MVYPGTPLYPIPPPGLPSLGFLKKFKARPSAGYGSVLLPIEIYKVYLPSVKTRQV